MKFMVVRWTTYSSFESSTLNQEHEQTSFKNISGTTFYPHHLLAFISLVFEVISELKSKTLLDGLNVELQVNVAQ